ncbi:MAG: phosphatidylinositol-specific phospholipase C [Akkermansiaceae bacterium]
MMSLLTWGNVLACIFILNFTAHLQASPVWMKQSPDGAKLSELTIIGTHNSCALHGGDYGKCQSIGLKEQLESGVRFIDVRCQWRDGDLHIVHGISDQKMRFSEVADICQIFLKENPGEVILMSVMEQSSRDKKRGDFGRAFQKVINKNKNQWYQKKLSPTLGDARGKVVVVSRNREVEGIPWRAFRVQDSFWINKGNSLDDKWSKVTEHFKGVGAGEELSINFISCTGIINPPHFTASKLNPKLISYLKKRRGKRLGIVVVDFFTAEMFQVVNAD